MKNEHGGKRVGAGRKATGVNETKVIRVDTQLVTIVEELKRQFKETGNVTFNQDGNLLQKIEELKQKLDFRQEKMDEIGKANAKLTVQSSGLISKEALNELTDNYEELKKQVRLKDKEIKSLKAEIDKEKKAITK